MKCLCQVFYGCWSVLKNIDQRDKCFTCPPGSLRHLWHIYIAFELCQFVPHSTPPHPLERKQMMSPQKVELPWIRSSRCWRSRLETPNILWCWPCRCRCRCRRLCSRSKSSCKSLLLTSIFTSATTIFLLLSIFSSQRSSNWCLSKIVSNDYLIY